MKNYIKQVYRYALTHRIVSALILGIIGGLVVGSLILRGGENVAVNAERTLPQVTVESVSELNTGGALLPLVGTVESESEATIQTERSGQVTSLNYKLGDRVPAGAIIASIQNQSERASVAQAQAAFQAAAAGFSQLRNRLSRESSTSQTESFNNYRAAYITADNAINNQTDPFFQDDRTAYPKLVLNVSNDERLERVRVEVGEILRRWRLTLEDLSSESNMLSHLNQAENDLRTIQNFLNELSGAANRSLDAGEEGAEASAADRAALSAARDSVNASLSTLISTRNSLVESSGASGERESTIAAEEANVNQTRAALRAAEANLEKTIIRAPIGGFISAIDLKLGDYVGMNAPVVTITNPGALEVVTFITDADTQYVSVNSEVLIDDTYRGRVTRIAPGLNPLTQKIEMRIGLLDQNQGLTPGQTVRVSLTSRPAEANSSQGASAITIPLTALKLNSDTATVFTVEEGKLVAHPIVVERVLGESVLIESGITPDMRIVVDARGRKAGEAVTVAE